MEEPRDIVREVSERWNAGDFEGLLELYHDDVSVHTGEHWPERHVLEGKAAFRESIDEWLTVWESIAVETDHVEGTMPIHIVFTVRDGKIARVDWCPDHERAVATARDA